jgi:hypothetical protein
MKPIGINRRALLATMATLPVLPSLVAKSVKKAEAQAAHGRALGPSERSV